MAAPAEARVVDASVAIKWHLTDEEHTEGALRLLEQFARGDVLLAAPAQIRYEVPSAITVATLGTSPRLSQTEAEAAIAEFLALGIHIDSSDEVIRSAFPLVHQHGLAYYDALYLALSRRLPAPLITADRRMYRLIRHLPDVVWIGDY
jgi:predicted nucleic acid-binding protein